MSRAQLPVIKPMNAQIVEGQAAVKSYQKGNMIACGDISGYNWRARENSVRDIPEYCPHPVSP